MAQTTPVNDSVSLPVTGTVAGITATPTLSPGFSTSIHDYVVRCPASLNNRVTLVLTGAGTIRVGPQSGSTVTVTVTLKENQAVVVSDGSGASASQYWVRCLPPDFPRLQFSRPGNPPPGWYLTGNIVGAPDGSSTPYAMILDHHGTPVWYRKAPGGAVDTRLLPGNRIAWSPVTGPGVGADPTKGYNAFDLDTQTTETLKATLGPTDFHEMLPLANGDRAMISTPLLSGVDLSSFLLLHPQVAAANNTIVDCIIEQLSPTGQLVWSWKASEHIRPNEASNPHVVNVNGTLAADVYHCNSVDLDPTAEPREADVLISVRHTDAVYLINRATGGIRWKMGGNLVVGPDTEKRLLTPFLGDSQLAFRAQHDARFRGNNRFSLFDNHSFGPGYARGVEYEVNAALGLVSHVWEHAAPDGKNSTATGSFRRYANGTDNLVGWGIKAGSGFDEVDENGNLLASLTFPTAVSTPQGVVGDVEYRVVKEPPEALDVNLLRRTAGLPAPGVPTTTWVPLGGLLTSKPGTASWAPNRLDTFVRGGDNQLWHLWWQDGNWYGWEPLGGLLTSGPAVAAWAPGRLDIFVRGGDLQLWHLAWQGGWSSWEPLGGLLNTGPAAASWGEGHLDVAVTGGDGAVWHRSFDHSSGWSTWQSLGGLTADDPGMTSWGPGRVDVFVRGTDPIRQLWHRWKDGGAWQTWQPIGNTLTTGPSAASRGTGLIDVAAAGPGTLPQRLPYNGTWQFWQPLGGATSHPPSLFAMGPSQEHVFVTGTDNQLWLGLISEGPTATADPGLLPRTRTKEARP